AGAAGWLHEDALSMPGAAALGDRLRLLGAVTDADLYPLYKGADLFAFPSIHEGFGLPPLEAMAQGTPVICTDVSSLPEVTAGGASPATGSSSATSTRGTVGLAWAAGTGRP